MGNLTARLKATLLRRDSKPLTPPLTKNSFGRDCASIASTHTQLGYDASDERSDYKIRGDSRSLNKLPSLDGSAVAAAAADRVQRAFSDESSETRQVHHIVKTHGSNDSSATPASPGAPPARVGSGADAGKTSAKTAPPSIKAGEILAIGLDHSDSAPTPTLNSDDATTASGNDLQNVAVNSCSSTTITSAPTPTIIASTSTTATATATATATVTTTGIPTASNTATTLPSIHKHPATPPKGASSTHSETEPEVVASPDSRAAIVNVGHALDDIITPLDGHLSPSLLTPPTTSSLRPPLSPSSFSRPLSLQRKQSILPAHQTNLFRSLLNGHNTNELELDAADLDRQLSLSTMVTRKIWVKRPLASATLVAINEDDLVDDVREMILRKYANSLGRLFDAPDLTLRICNREQQTSRTLQPDEPICKVIDSYYANGQTVDDALLIDIPSRRTPKASPNPRFYADDRPHESGTDYFPPYPPPAHSHHSATTTLANAQHSLHFTPSMSVLGGNQLPPLPSPGSTRRLALQNRPNMQRMHTSSPVSTVANSHTSQAGAAITGTHKYSRPVRSRTHSGASSDQSNHPPAAPSIPTPPAADRIATPPPPRVSSPRPSNRPKKNKRPIEPPSLPSGLLDTAVPPINILIVEDNMINLRLLEAFVKRLKVRWQTAVNGREAVDKWRAGGFHLVLMDIQLPIMNGLEATREIRRIEKVNSIGVFSSSASSPPDEIMPEPAEQDKLANTEMFKSPVIIVALTASSLQSDRHEALAAGCNDFLTKPVNFDWLQRKVKEWGCMQALIDFDGWRKWKDFSQKTQVVDAAKKTAISNKAKPVKKNRLSMAAAA